jgi:hypothetical protein
MILDAADAVSENATSANEFLKSEGVDMEAFVKRGLNDLNSSISKAKKSLNKSQSFFHRVVLAARIAHECYDERTFGIVKFQKLLFLCEHVCNMRFYTKYTKQAAGPMDNRFIHAVKAEFERQGWFKVQKDKRQRSSKVVFIPLEGINGYRPYYERYYGDSDEAITHLIETFRQWRTEDIELVATIYSCVEEIHSEGAEVTEDSVVKRVYDWHEEKEKFNEAKIIRIFNWMSDTGIYPA